MIPEGALLANLNPPIDRIGARALNFRGESTFPLKGVCIAMKTPRATILWGIGLLVVGILLLLQNLGVLEEFIPFIWMGLFAIGGIVFIGIYVSHRERWWAIIPGGALIGITLLMVFKYYLPQVDDVVGGALFLIMLSGSFIVVVAVNRGNWWAVIPAGVLLSAALVILLDYFVPQVETGAIMLLGIAVTFGILSRVRTPQGRLSWPLVPAIVLFAVGLLLLTQSLQIPALVIAILMIAGGGYLLLHSVK